MEEVMNFGSSRPSSRLSAAMEFAEEMSDVIGDVHLDEEGHVFDPRSAQLYSLGFSHSRVGVKGCIL